VQPRGSGRALREPAEIQWSRGAASDIDGQTERSNGAFGKSDIEGKTATEATSELGKERVSNGREHMSQLGNERVANLWTISRFAAAEIQSHTAAGIARTDDASHYNFASD